MNRRLTPLLVLLAGPWLAGCDADIRLRTPPVGTTVTAPFFGSLGAETIWAEACIDVPQARGVEVLAAAVSCTLANKSTLSMSIRVDLSASGTAAPGTVGMGQAPPAGWYDDPSRTLFNIALAPGGRLDCRAGLAECPAIGEVIPRGRFWVVVRATVSGVALAPALELEDLVADILLRKDCGPLAPLLDLF